MPLSADQFEELQKAFIDTHDKESLKMLFKLKLNRKLENEVNTEQGFEAVVLETLEKAETEGWLRLLVEKAIEYYTGNNDTTPLALVNFLQKYKQELPLSGQPLQDYSLLISMCNPEDSPTLLKEALERQHNMMMEKKRMIPLVCIVHGDIDDLSNNIVRNRLADIEIKEFLSAIDRLHQPGKENTKKIPLPWQAKVEDLPKYFSRTLLETFCADHDNQNDRKDLKNAIRILINYPEQLMFYYMSDISWDAGGEISGQRSKLAKLIGSLNFFSQSPEEKIQNKIKAFLDFWNDPLKFVDSDKSSKDTGYSEDIKDDPFVIDESVPPKPLLIFLFYKYRHFAEPRKQDQRLNTKMHEFFTDLDFSDYPNICGVVLPHIEPVGEGLVYNWLHRKPIFKDFCRLHPLKFCDIASLENDVQGFYNNETNEHILKDEKVYGKIRMRFLTEFLNERLNRYSCRERI